MYRLGKRRKLEAARQGGKRSQGRKAFPSQIASSSPQGTGCRVPHKQGVRDVDVDKHCFSFTTILKLSQESCQWVESIQDWLAIVHADSQLHAAEGLTQAWLPNVDNREADIHSKPCPFWKYAVVLNNDDESEALILVKLEVATHNCHAAVLLRRSGHWAGNGYQKVGRNCIPGNTNLHPRGKCQSRYRQSRGTLDNLAARLRPRADTLTMLLYKGKAVKPRSKSNNS